jgi:DNA modification methylase
MGSMGDLSSFASSVEYILFSQKGKRGLFGKRHGGVFTYNVQKTPDHPTPKPVGLIKELVLLSSQEGELVVDGFAGSGPVAVACKELKRSYKVIEIYKKYYEVILKNLSIVKEKETKEVKEYNQLKLF